MIVGKVDASGSATYNQALSTKRAASVRRYLVERHQIKPDLLMAVGKGETELYDANKPNSNINRRVRVKHAGQ